MEILHGFLCPTAQDKLFRKDLGSLKERSEGTGTTFLKGNPWSSGS